MRPMRTQRTEIIAVTVEIVSKLTTIWKGKTEWARAIRYFDEPAIEWRDEQKADTMRPPKDHIEVEISIWQYW